MYTFSRFWAGSDDSFLLHLAFDCHILSLCHDFAFTCSAFTAMNKLIHNKNVRVVGEFGLTIYLHDSGKIG